MMLNMFHGTLQPLAGAVAHAVPSWPRTACCRGCSRRRSRRDVPWVATFLTAGMSIVFLLHRRPDLDDRRRQPRPT